MIDDAFITARVERLRREVSGAVAILLKGSYARGDPGPFSDLDFDVLTAGGPRSTYPAYIVEPAPGRRFHVSVAVRDLAGWLAEADEPQEWAFYLPSEEAVRILWVADDALRARLPDDFLRHPPGEPELEDFVADYGKVKNARRRGDELALRLAAHGLAMLCPSVLRPLNPGARVGTREEALKAALAFPASPPGYRDDMLICLGLSEAATTADDVAHAARRLVLGVLALLRPKAGVLAHLLPSGLATALSDGTLERYAAQDRA